MTIPVYTELSNFSVRKAGSKVQTELTMALIIGRDSDPVDTINSLYSYIKANTARIELIIVNTDREGYKYEKLMDSFPALRILLPQENITYAEALELVLNESLSEQVLFLDQEVRLQSLDLTLLKSYFTQSSFGALVPRVYDAEGEALPNLVKGSLRQGWLDTISVLLKGSAVTSLYPGQACFITRKDLFREPGISLHTYQDRRFTLLELGYRLWKQGYMIFQGEKFKVQLSRPALPDIRMDLDDTDYLLFNYVNITDRTAVLYRKRALRRKAALLFLTLRWKRLGQLMQTLSEYRSRQREAGPDPIDDNTVFRTINKDYE